MVDSGDETADSSASLRNDKKEAGGWQKKKLRNDKKEQTATA